MKSHVFAGVSAAAAAFLVDRKEAVRLAPLRRRTTAAYVWSTVLLKARGRRS